MTRPGPDDGSRAGPGPGSSTQCVLDPGFGSRVTGDNQADDRHSVVFICEGKSSLNLIFQRSTANEGETL